MNSKANKPESISKTNEERQDIVVQCWLTEYQALRSEILSNSRERGALVGLNIIAIGSLIGLAFSTHSYLFVGLISILSSCLGIIWVTKNGWTVQLCNYIRDKIAPAMQSLSGDSAIFQWETSVRAKWEFKQFVPALIKGEASGTATVSLIFLAPSVASLAVSIYAIIMFSQYRELYFFILLGTAIFLTAILAFSGFIWLKEWRIERS